MYFQSFDISLISYLRVPKDIFNADIADDVSHDAY